MGKFSNIFGNKTDDGQSSGQGNPNAALPLRLLAIGYLVYLIYQMVQSYAAGGADAPSGAGFWIGVIALSLGTLLIAVLTYRQWRQQKEPAQDTLPEAEED